MSIIEKPQMILVVEDSDDDFFATERAFKKADLRNPVQRCATGDEALDFLFQRGAFAHRQGLPNPSLILLDLNLPSLDGRQVLHAIKSDSKLHRIPVVVLTTSVAEQDIARCYDEGANSYIHKPVDMLRFVEAIIRLKEYWFEVAVLPKVG